MFKFKLGQKVKDKVTGYQGIITGRTEWLNGCIRYCIQAKKKKDGTIPETEHVDEAQVRLVDQGLNTKKKKTGGPQQAPKYMENPR